MAFFDFDRKIQTLLIAGAIASVGACGGTTDLSGGSDTSTDTVADTVVDTLVDTGIDTGMDTPWPEMVDPPPDMLDPDVHGVCPDPAGWALDVLDGPISWPTMTIRVILNVPEEFIDESEPEFSVEKRYIDAVREVAPNEYEIDYRWSGALEYGWWDWDRLNVTWRVACFDAGGINERVLTDQKIICVSDGFMYLGWGSDPEGACMVVDCVPNPMDEESSSGGFHAMGVDSRPADLPTSLPKGALSTRIIAVPAVGGAIHLTAQSSGPLASKADHAWSASAGTIDASGPTAVWHPPATPGVHTVQVVTTSGSALSIDVFRLSL